MISFKKIIFGVFLFFPQHERIAEVNGVFDTFPSFCRPCPHIKLRGEGGAIPAIGTVQRLRLIGFSINTHQSVSRRAVRYWHQRVGFICCSSFKKNQNQNQKMKPPLAGCIPGHVQWICRIPYYFPPSQ